MAEEIYLDSKALERPSDSMRACFGSRAQHSFGLSYHSGVAIDFSGHSNAHLSDKQINAANKVNSQIRTANNAIRSIRSFACFTAHPGCADSRQMVCR